MSRTLLLVSLLLPALLAADDKWTEFRYGPFTVYSSAGDKPAREALNRLEQFRNAFGQAIGKQDPVSPWPVVLVLPKKPSGMPARFTLSRDGYISEGLSAAAFCDLGRIFLDSNFGALPLDIETALLDLYSTLQVEGTYVTLGAPPEGERKTLDWARLQLLSTDPRYSGRMRVFLYNLSQTTDREPAYKNAFGRTPEQIEKEVKEYFAAGKFATGSVNGRAVKPERDFASKAADPARIRLLTGDLLLAAGAEAARVRQAYGGIDSIEVKDGIALATLNVQDLKAATGAGSTNPRVWFEYGRKLDQADQALAAFQQAGKLQPKWYAPAYGMSQLETDPKRKAYYLAAAAKLEPRNSALWQALATAQTEAGQYTEATRAWANAERSSPTAAERERIRQIRNSLAEKRLDQEAQERRLAAEAKERELSKLKQDMMSRIREAEARANQGQAPLDPKVPVISYAEANQGNPKVPGVLERVDCLGEQARLHIRKADRTTLQLLVPHSGKLAITGGGQRTIACGPQRPARKLVVEYNDVANAKLGTAGEVVAIEFQ